MNEVWLIVIMAFVAFAYAMVGHGGASGYLAVLAIFNYQQDVTRPSALLLNLCVSAIAFTQFMRAGHFQWRTFWPFALLSVPAAWLGARVELDPVLYKRLLAICLLFAVARLFGLFKSGSAETRPVPVLWALVIGAVLGFVSGMIGIGGGILLSPVLLLLRWADAKTTAATSALFIFVNSLSGILSLSMVGFHIGSNVLAWIGAAICGGVLGSWIGARHMPEPRLRQALGIVLLLASVKLFWP